MSDQPDLSEPCTEENLPEQLALVQQVDFNAFVKLVDDNVARPEDREWMASVGITMADFLSYMFTSEHQPKAREIHAAWDESLGFTYFGEGGEYANILKQVEEVEMMKDYIARTFGPMGVDRVVSCDDDGNECHGFDIAAPPSTQR